MYQEAFQKLEKKDIETLLERINPLLEGCTFEPSQTTIMAQKISFYPGYRYFDIADYSSVPPAQRFVIDDGSETIILDWTNAPLYALNEKLPIVLNEDTVTNYVRFFFDHVRGTNGRFLIAENIDDIRWRDDPPPAARKSIGQMIVPLSFKDTDRKGNFVVSMTVVFKDSLVKCDAIVTPNGEIDLANEEVLVEDMPVLDDSTGQ